MNGGSRLSERLPPLVSERKDPRGHGCFKIQSGTSLIGVAVAVGPDVHAGVPLNIRLLGGRERDGQLLSKRLPRSVLRRDTRAPHAAQRKQCAPVRLRRSVPRLVIGGIAAAFPPRTLIAVRKGGNVHGAALDLYQLKRI